MRCGCNAQQLLSSSHSGVVDGLNVDVVTGQHDVTDLSVFLGVGHLQENRLGVTLRDSYSISNSCAQKVKLSGH